MTNPGGPPKEDWDKRRELEFFQRYVATLSPEQRAKRNVSLSEVAGVLGKPPTEIEGLVVSGALSAGRTPSGLVFSIDDLMRYAGRGLASRRAPGGSAPVTRAERQRWRQRESALRLFAGLSPEARSRPRYSMTTMARHLHVSRAMIKAHAEAGILPGHRTPSGHWKFPIDSMLLGLGGPQLSALRPKTVDKSQPKRGLKDNQ